MDTDNRNETSLSEEVAFDREDGFIDYLALRLRVETSEARARLSAWLAAYEPPARSGVHGPPREANEANERARSG